MSTIFKVPVSIHRTERVSFWDSGSGGQICMRKSILCVHYVSIIIAWHIQNGAHNYSCDINTSIHFEALLAGEPCIYYTGSAI